MENNTDPSVSMPDTSNAATSSATSRSVIGADHPEFSKLLNNVTFSTFEAAKPLPTQIPGNAKMGIPYFAPSGDLVADDDAIDFMWELALVCVGYSYPGIVLDHEFFVKALRDSDRETMKFRYERLATRKFAGLLTKNNCRDPQGILYTPETALAEAEWIDRLYKIGKAAMIKRTDEWYLAQEERLDAIIP
ncbi:hypothetical protein BT63DRAFT_113236 [Microthyrium microscopicum]|uniref:Uncharacterized protein n=1 Tax=Microthyrium microscopicum TaxID=703497 RepID=A0A6A6TXE9_9PEZI|nr:hypothetical protein BT63DRAFT_113236 [Microthyrium microscopicum]